MTITEINIIYIFCRGGACVKSNMVYTIQLAPPEKEFLFRNDIKNTQCEFCESGSNKLRFYCFCKVCEIGKA